MQITTTIKDEIVKALGEENIQAELDNKVLELENRASSVVTDNLIAFLEVNPQIKEKIKENNDLDDSFKPKEAEPVPDEAEEIALEENNPQ